MLPDDRLVRIDCPAKVNLSLAILGRREDGFHGLHSVVAQVALADSLELQWLPGGSPADDSLHIEGADLPAGENTVMAALRLFRATTGFDQGAFRARLHKRIPSGAGLGGGSSDAVGLFKGLQRIFAHQVGTLDWAALAAEIGSDCPLFLRDEPVIMEGRGERIRPLPEKLAARFRGKPLLLFKPRFSVPTAEAYRRLAAGGYYTDRGINPLTTADTDRGINPLTTADTDRGINPLATADTDRGINPLATVESAFMARRTLAAEEQMRKWEAGEAALPPAWNDFERLVEDWMPSLAVVLHRLRTRHGLEVRMSGSGSACFIFPNGRSFDRNAIEEELRAAFAGFYWIEETAIN